MMSELQAGRTLSLLLQAEKSGGTRASTNGGNLMWCVPSSPEPRDQGTTNKSHFSGGARSPRGNMGRRHSCQPAEHEVHTLLGIAAMPLWEGTTAVHMSQNYYMYSMPCVVCVQNPACHV